MSKDTLQDKIREAEAYYEAAVRDAENAKKELEELRKVAGAEKYNSWIGKLGFFDDDNPECPDDGYLKRMTRYHLANYHPFQAGAGACYRYFRPATPEELGCPGYDALKEFVDRIATCLNPDDPRDMGWSWVSLVNEARHIMKDIPNE